MKAHNLEAIGHLKLSYTPTAPDHAVRKVDLESVQGASAQPVFVTNVEPLNEGNVGSKQYADTIPSNQVLLSCASDSTDLRIHFLAESGISFYNPTVKVDDSPADSLTEVPGDRRLFQGYKDITVTESRDVVVSSSTGASTKVSILMADAGPSISSLSVDSLPGTQTAVKAGDTIDISGTVANAATDVSILNRDAVSVGSVSLGASDSGGAGLRTFSGTAVVSSRSGSLPVVAQASNSLGTKGETFSSSPIDCDQTYPTVEFSIVSMSNGGPYLGMGDTAEVSVSISGQDSQSFGFAYGDPGGDTSQYLTSRTLTVEAAVFSSTGGVSITANRSSNGSSTSRTFTVPVASEPVIAQLSILGSTLDQTTVASGGFPAYGTAAYSVDSASEIEALQTTSDSSDNQTFSVSASASEYGYFAYPAVLGLATFTDTSSGISGGWDGASWPADGSIGSTYGPITVQKDGIDWYVYRTDFQGVSGTFSVSFENPGVSAGSKTVQASFLQTDSDGVIYTVRVDFDQSIDNAPSLTAPVGEWTSSWAKVYGTRWERSLKVDNSMPRGVYEFLEFSVINRGGHETSVLGSGAYYALAGFDQVTVTFPAFARMAPIGVSVFDALNTVARYAGSQTDLTFRTDTSDTSSAYTIVDSDGNYAPNGGTHIWLNDTNFAASNTSGTLQVEIEESV